MLVPALFAQVHPAAPAPHAPAMPAAPAPAAYHPGDGLIGLDKGYFDMYNLDFADAHRVFAVWMKDHPADPIGPASDAAAYLFAEFDRLNILDIELFADPDKFDARAHPVPNDESRRLFNERSAQADKLADDILKHDPKNAAALYAKTLMCGMRANYAALIDKKDYTALKFTEQGSKLAKLTLEADPKLYDAYIAVGVENYVLSLKPGILKFFLNLRGDGTSKEEGMRQLTLCSDKGHFLAPFARMMLAVAYLRDGRHAESKALLASLSQEFPGNSLYRRELAKAP
jgi:hypothetical protein